MREQHLLDTALGFASELTQGDEAAPSLLSGQRLELELCRGMIALVEIREPSGSEIVELEHVDEEAMAAADEYLLRLARLHEDSSLSDDQIKAQGDLLFCRYIRDFVRAVTGQKVATLGELDETSGVSQSYISQLVPTRGGDGMSDKTMNAKSSSTSQVARAFATAAQTRFGTVVTMMPAHIQRMISEQAISSYRGRLGVARPGIPLDPDAKNVVHHESITSNIDTLLRDGWGEFITIMGLPDSGKTTYLEYAKQQAANAGYAVVNLSGDALDCSTPEAQARSIAQRLSMYESLDDIDPESTKAHAIVGEFLRRFDGDVLLMVDDFSVNHGTLEAAYPPLLSLAVGVRHAASEFRHKADDGARRHLAMIAAGEYRRAPAGSYHPVRRHETRPFTREQVLELGRHIATRFSEADAKEVFHITRGQPLLTQSRILDSDSRYRTVEFDHLSKVARSITSYPLLHAATLEILGMADPSPLEIDDPELNGHMTDSSRRMRWLEMALDYSGLTDSRGVFTTRQYEQQLAEHIGVIVNRGGIATPLPRNWL